MAEGRAQFFLFTVLFLRTLLVAILGYYKLTGSFDFVTLQVLLCAWKLLDRQRLLGCLAFCLPSSRSCVSTARLAGGHFSEAR